MEVESRSVTVLEPSGMRPASLVIERRTHVEGAATGGAIDATAIETRSWGFTRVR
jgi:hypothetical protein